MEWWASLRSWRGVDVGQVGLRGPPAEEADGVALRPRLAAEEAAPMRKEWPECFPQGSLKQWGTAGGGGGTGCGWRRFRFVGERRICRRRMLALSEADVVGQV